MLILSGISCCEACEQSVACFADISTNLEQSVYTLSISSGLQSSVLGASISANKLDLTFSPLVWRTFSKYGEFPQVCELLLLSGKPVSSCRCACSSLSVALSYSAREVTYVLALVRKSWNHAFHVSAKRQSCAGFMVLPYSVILYVLAPSTNARSDFVFLLGSQVIGRADIFLLRKLF